jgi:hypothetical protein
MTPTMLPAASRLAPRNPQSDPRSKQDTKLLHLLLHQHLLHLLHLLMYLHLLHLRLQAQDRRGKRDAD